ncbi:hypothetical protein V1514DRAFT_31980 [Lipomyces japonicus]|uniref:uncharacterized protein n=1 Tax=Lipomyces japonicus TaxID=56871 RepID=UPI0034D01BFF
MTRRRILSAVTVVALVLLLIVLVSGGGSGSRRGRGSSRPHLVVLGDSWSADGKHDVVVDPAVRNHGPGTGGRWSNGPVWPEYLCESVKCQSYLNLALGGAKSSNRAFAASASAVPDLEAQYSAYAGLNLTYPDNRSLLFVIFFGINDLVYAVSSPSGRQAAVASSVAQIVATTAKLTGAYPHSNVLLFSAVDITLLPMYATRFLSDGGNRDDSKNKKNNNNNSSQELLENFKDAAALVRAWNSQLRRSADEYHVNHTNGSVFFWDTNAWFARQVAGVVKHGLPVYNRVCVDRVAQFECANPQDYLFWDWVHLTTVAHKRIANQLARIDLLPSLRKFQAQI